MSSIIITGAHMRNVQTLANQLANAFEKWAREDVNNDYWNDQFRDMGLWDYNRETRRKNGEVVGSPRDIYDTGALYESGRESFTVDLSANMASANWNWDARNSSGRPYAYYVHEGVGTNYDNPRPWTDELAVPQKFETSAIRQALLNRIRASLGPR